MADDSLIYDAHGRQAEVLDRSDDGRRLLVQLPDHQRLWVSREVLDSQGGRPTLRVPFESLGTPSARGRSDQVVVPAMEERLRIEREQVDTGVVQLRKEVVERPEVVREPVVREDVEIERIPVNRVADGPTSIRYEGDTMIVPLLEEVIVVEKRLMVREEVRIRKRRSVEQSETPVTLRKEEIHVERKSMEDDGNNGNDSSRTIR